MKWKIVIFFYFEIILVMMCRVKHLLTAAQHMAMAPRTTAAAEALMYAAPELTMPVGHPLEA
tara:strand:- start:345 stop:530 length:186 start_codon:yes stop_codon:yes gene_type:complete